MSQEDRIVRLRKDGWSFERIGREMGVSRSTIKRTCLAAGVHDIDIWRLDDKETLIKQLLKDGYPIYDIAKRAKTSRDRVYAINAEDPRVLDPEKPPPEPPFPCELHGERKWSFKKNRGFQGVCPVCWGNATKLRTKALAAQKKMTEQMSEEEISALYNERRYEDVRLRK